MKMHRASTLQREKYLESCLTLVRAKNAGKEEEFKAKIENHPEKNKKLLIGKMLTGEI